MEDKKKILQEIKKDFFFYKNGIIADSLRKLYDTDVIVFGLNLPQIIDLSKKYPKDIQIGIELWNDKKVRESRLLALYLLPATEIPYSMASEMILDVRSIEEAELLAFRLLKYLSYAEDLLKEFNAKENLEAFPLHCVRMLGKNLDLQSSND